MPDLKAAEPASSKPVNEVPSAVIRFAGDSGDGMQLTGAQFTNTAMHMGEDVATLPDYPSEIRAPAGTTFGVSGYQLCFGSEGVFTPGDLVDVLVVMNPAAMKTNLPLLRPGGILVANIDAFSDKANEKAGYTTDPFLAPELETVRVFQVPIAKLTQTAVADLTLTKKQADQCRNFFALGLSYWLYSRPMDSTAEWLKKKFRDKPELIEANLRVMEAGWNYGESTDAFRDHYRIRHTDNAKKPGTYRHITGNQAMAMGLLAAAHKANRPLFLGSYPITPATDIMHELVKYPGLATVLQTEDEIAAIGTAIGAAYGGSLAVTTTSGPGLSLKSEFINLAVMVELPLVIVDVQRGGPSTGLPTKTEQADLNQALYGRHGESPIVVLASSSPHDCFDVAVEASRIAIEHMTPVIVLSDGYLGNGAEVWRVPELDELPDIKKAEIPPREEYAPYLRDPKTLARPWVAPGLAGYEHRIGGLEKEDVTGELSSVPANHEHMVRQRAKKVALVAADIPHAVVEGPEDAELLIVGWGSTYRVIRQVVKRLQNEGLYVAQVHLRHLNPFPSNLEEILHRYPQILVPENNLGQLASKLRSEFFIWSEKKTKIQGLPFRADELEAKIREVLGVEQ